MTLVHALDVGEYEECRSERRAHSLQVVFAENATLQHVHARSNVEVWSLLQELQDGVQGGRASRQHEDEVQVLCIFGMVRMKQL
mmetsp:Transcript_60689/g.107810  ORF Transcript_60689/g.107810 Transcript_60689/m.107810 type:complete len:84 (+) Transcript_60689:478-729(+)